MYSHIYYHIFLLIHSFIYIFIDIFIHIYFDIYVFFIGTLMENLRLANETIVTLHANYIKGNSNKANKMKEYGFWLKKGEIQTNRLSQGLTPIHENTCIPYVPSHLQINERESLKASSS